MHEVLLVVEEKHAERATFLETFQIMLYGGVKNVNEVDSTMPPFECVEM